MALLFGHLGPEIRKCGRSDDDRLTIAIGRSPLAVTFVQQPRPLSQEVGGIAAEQGGVADFVSVSAARLNDEVRLLWFGHDGSILCAAGDGGEDVHVAVGGDWGFQAVEVADVAAVEHDCYEAADCAGLV